MKNPIKSLAIALAVGFGGLAAASSAHATAMLYLDDGLGNTVTILDGGAGDSSGAAGAVTWIGTLGAWTLNVSTGITMPILGSVTAPRMDLNSVNVSTAAGILTIRFSEVGFGPVGGAGGAVAEIGGTAQTAVGYSTYYDAGNTALATTTVLTDNGDGGPGAFSSTTGGQFPGGSPFSLTQEIVITHAGPGASSFNASLNVPEGGFTLSLLGGAMLGMGVFRSKMRKA